MCKCFEKVKEKVLSDIVVGLPEHQEFKGEWENKSLFFGENAPKNPVGIPLAYSYRRIKVNGEPYRSLERSSVKLTINYCPFCGENQKC